MIPLLLILLLLSLFLLYRSTIKPDHFPPGPFRWPLIGGALSLIPGGSLFRGVRAALARHGSIVGVYMGRIPVVLIADFDLVRDLFQREEVSSRPSFGSINYLRPGVALNQREGRVPGVTFSSGKFWSEQKRVVLRQLKNTDMEGMIHKEVEKLTRKYHDRTNKPFVLERSINFAIVNLLLTFMVGDNLELEDPKLTQIVHLIQTLLQNNNFFSPLNIETPLPFLKLRFVRRFSGFHKVKHAFDGFKTLIEPHLKEHRMSFQRDNLRDLMDLFIQEIQEATDENSPFYGKAGEGALHNTFNELFMAGMESTSSSLIWTFLFMVRHPEMQGRVHEELDKVCGRDRLPSLSDRDRLPYTNAIIHESLRMSSVSFVGVPHFTTDKHNKLRSTEGMLLERFFCKVNCVNFLNGKNKFFIPKDSVVFGCLHSIMNDPVYWRDPEIFSPERFIEEETGRFIPDERVVPFGIGKRACVGQTLARKELFLFFTGIMQSFRIECRDCEMPSYDPESCFVKGILRKPPQFKVVLKNRDK